MAFWDLIFNKIEPEEGPSIRFGRFSDAYKDPAQYDSWDKSLLAYEQESYLESIRYFFEYLTDTHIQNAKWWEKDSKLYFELFQGSKKITGVADQNKLRGEARIAKGKELNVGLLRRLVEHNYALKYSRYALDEEQYISVVFDTFLLDGSPYKLYYALKEMSTQADKQDDLLVNEFDALEPINTGHVKHLPLKEKEIKFRFFKNEISKLFKSLKASKVSTPKFPEATGYMLLALCYKLDYLLAPEGTIMETFERINRQYLAKDQKNQIQKISKVKKEIDELDKIDEESFNQELYYTTSTFGISIPVNQQQIKDHILSELDKMDWFQKGKLKSFRLAIPSYIIGYALFNYAVPEPIKDLFHMYYRIIDNEYFIELGFTQNYLKEDHQLNIKTIKRSLKNVIKKYEKKYPNLKLDKDQINFHSLSTFSKSYLQLIAELDLTKMD